MVEVDQILDSIKYVIQKADYIKINYDKLSKFVKNFKSVNKFSWVFETPFKIHNLSDNEKLMLMVIFNSISFSYWGDPYWNVNYKGNHTRGSWSLIASIFRAIDEGKDILNPSFLLELSKDELAQILRGNTEIPLLEERQRILNEVGKVLIEKFEGDFTNVLKQSQGNAKKLFQIILDNFAYFEDYAEYKGRKVFFYKRAQALVESVYAIFEGKNYGNLKGIDSFTALADYIIPNFFRELGIMEYSKELANKIDNKILLKKGSPEEVEIRATTIWVTELIRKELESRGIKLNAFEVNDYLWIFGREGVSKPFHRTRTTCY